MNIDKCNVLWDTPSEDSLGSMPLGNGDVGANVWATEDGAIHLYLSKTDAWDESMRLLKLGELELSTSDAPLREWVAEGFAQSLELERGRIGVRFGASEAPRATIVLWIDAHRPVLHVESKSAASVRWRVRLRTWRTTTRELVGPESHSSLCQKPPHETAYVYPDRALTAAEIGAERLGLMHRNRRSVLPQLLEHQQLADLADGVDDPLANRTFGCLVQCETSAVDVDGSLAEQRLTTKTAQPAVRFSVLVHCQRCAAEGTFIEALQTLAETARSIDLETARTAHASWWQGFWQRSFIDVTGDAAAEAVTRAYTLQRYVTACAGRGVWPIKFNGSIFTMQGPAKTDKASGETVVYDPDYRQWGGGYWFQNTRLIYWAMLAAGDWEMMRPWFDYFQRVLPLCRHRCRKHLDIDGAFFPETMTIWGTFLNNNYGYERPADLSPALSENHYIRLYWQGGLELSTILLDYLAHTGDQDWWRRQAYPIVVPLLCFYYGYYTARDDDGNIHFTPSQSLETWHDADNPTPDIAGLAHVLDGLLALPDTWVNADDREFLANFRDKLPPVPTGVVEDGGPNRILPAERYSQRKNMENCSLYAVFPYPQGALGGPLLEEARAAWPQRHKKAIGGWFQDAVHAAMLGYGDEAADMVTAAFAPEHLAEAPRDWQAWQQHPDIRFPGFFGPNCDWVPDQDHGCVNSLALQRMCLQTQHGKLRILPAWPKHWNVHFRLHAPDQTTVEAMYRNGTLESVDVSPEKRRIDMIYE